MGKKFKTQDETWQHNYPYDVKMTRTEYEYLKRQMQIELLKTDHIKPTNTFTLYSCESLD